MDEKRTDSSAYEPNFVMKDAEDDAKAAAPPGQESDTAKEMPEGFEAQDDYETSDGFEASEGFGTSEEVHEAEDVHKTSDDFDAAHASETFDGTDATQDTEAAFHATQDSGDTSQQGSTNWQTYGNSQGTESYQTFGSDLSHSGGQSSSSDETSYKGAYRDPRDAFRSSGANPYQYNEHNRPGSVKDNFSGSPYTGYVDENGNMHYSSAGASGQSSNSAGSSDQQHYEQQSGASQGGYSSQTYGPYGHHGTGTPGGGGFAGQQAGGEAYTSSWSSSDGVTRTHRAKKPKKPKAPKKPSKPVSLTRRSLALLIALCVVVSGLFGFGGAYLSNALSGGHSGSSKTASVSKNGYKLEDATGSKMTVQEVTNATKDSVVEIKTESVSSDAWMQQYVTEGAGSGVVMTADGYIMTNNHVIDGASKITVTTADDKEYEAKLVGTDSITDIAVIKISAKDLTPVTYGNSDQLAVGDMAVAIGNPLGELGGTVSAGIISALDRELAIDGKTMTLLQTDASINPGNSGGGLFNGDGQLIGIVVAKSSGSNVEGLGFAIPINKAADVAQQLMDKGYVSDQPSTGMSYSESSQGNGMSQFFGNSQDSQSQSSSATVYIQEVTGTNAKKAGFQQGDIVYAVDGTEITSFNTLSSIVTSHKVGDKLTFTIVRGNQTKDIKLTLEEKKASN